MNNLPLQPLVWSRALTAQSAFHQYLVRKDDEATKRSKSQYVVNYGRLNAQKSMNIATGFATIEDAKTWCWNHYNEKMQPYVKPDPIGTHFDNFTQWANDRQIIQNGDILAQGLKLVSEIGELADNLAKDRCIKDDIGDCFVVLNNLAQMTDTPLVDCLAQAWNDIKDRKGAMNEHGVFIKSGDVG